MSESSEKAKWTMFLITPDGEEIEISADVKIVGLVMPLDIFDLITAVLIFSELDE